MERLCAAPVVRTPALVVVVTAAGSLDGVLKSWTLPRASVATSCRNAGENPVVTDAGIGTLLLPHLCVTITIEPSCVIDANPEERGDPITHFPDPLIWAAGAPTGASFGFGPEM